MRLGLRRLSRAPHFTLLTLLVLTFAIGANITVFTVVYAVWLEPRPVRDPASLVIVMDVSPFGREDDIIGPEDLQVIRGAAIFEAVTTQKIYHSRSDASPRIHLVRTSRPVEALAVAPNYFEALGLTIWGRDFTAADDVVGAPAVGIISDRLWRTEFQRRPDAIGSVMETAGEPVTIVGVAPPGFTGALRGEQFDVWVPWAKARRLSLESVVTGLRQATLGLGIAIARLQPGVTPAEADAVVQAIPHPVSSAASYRVRPLGSVIGLPGQVTTPFGEQPVMKLIGGMAGVVLLAGCATLGILMLLHLEQRRRELREALGLPLLSGRDPIDEGEVLITRSLAARLWPDGDALGQPLRRDFNERVVGVVPDFVQGSIANDAAGGVIFHHAGQPNRMAVTVGVHFVAGTRSNAGPTVAVIEEMVARHFPNAMRSRVASGRQLVETDMTRQRLGATFFGGFGLVSTALGGVAVFGLVGHLVRSRARELGVRLALGATPNHLMASTVRTGLWPVCLGTAVGLLVAVALSGVIRAYIHGISPLDPVSYLGAAALLVVSAAAAGLLAARRIRRIAPMDALRAE